MAKEEWELEEEAVIDWAEEMSWRIHTLLHHCSELFTKPPTWFREAYGIGSDEKAAGSETCEIEASCDAAGSQTGASDSGLEIVEERIVSAPEPVFAADWDDDMDAAYRYDLNSKKKMPIREYTSTIIIPDAAKDTDPAIAVFADGSKHPLARFLVSDAKIRAQSKEKNITMQ